MNIQNNSNTQQLKDAYMVLSLKKIGQEKESSPIDFNTFSKLMKDDSVINPTLSREAPENFTTNDGVKAQDLKWSIEIDKIISKAFEKGLVNKNNLLVNDNLISQNIQNYSKSTNYNESKIDVGA